MKTTSFVAVALLVLAGLVTSGCRTAPETANWPRGADRDLRSDYRGDFGGARFPGPPLTGGGE